MVEAQTGGSEEKALPSVASATAQCSSDAAALTAAMCRVRVKSHVLPLRWGCGTIAPGPRALWLLVVVSMYQQLELVSSNLAAG